MKDLTRLSDTALAAARNNAFTAYYRAATHYDPNRDYSVPNLRFQKLERAIARMDAIDAEIERRMASRKNGEKN